MARRVGIWASRGACGVAFALGLAGCSPLIRVTLTIDLPATANQPSRLHVVGRVACDSFNLSLPRAAPPATPMPGFENLDPRSHVVFALDGDVATTEFHASRCMLAASAHYDANDNGVVDGGDFIGTLPAVVVRDRGLFDGNTNELRMGTTIVR